jgi:hypothetical protein
MMEHWNNGMMGSKMKKLIFFVVSSKFSLPLFQYSTIPIFQWELFGGLYGLRI